MTSFEGAEALSVTRSLSKLSSISTRCCRCKHLHNMSSTEKSLRDVSDTAWLLACWCYYVNQQVGTIGAAEYTMAHIVYLCTGLSISWWHYPGAAAQPDPRIFVDRALC